MASKEVRVDYERSGVVVAGGFDFDFKGGRGEDQVWLQFGGRRLYLATNYVHSVCSVCSVCSVPCMPPDAQMPTLPPPPADGSLRVLEVDFASVGLPDLSSRICLVIDNLLTTGDVTRLYHAATLSGPWTQAKVSVDIGVEILNTDYRNSSRIILDDHALAGWLYDKIGPFLGEGVRRVRGAEHHKWIGSSYYNGAVTKRKKEDGSEVVVLPVARVTRLNERLRFLRYEPGMYFQAHCDGQYWTPDTRECSYFTLQVYLEGEEGDGVSLPARGYYTDFLQNLLSEARPVFSARSRSIVQSLNRMKVSSVRTSTHISSNPHDLLDAPT